jgi:hypothetical protein
MKHKIPLIGLPVTTVLLATACGIPSTPVFEPPGAMATTTGPTSTPALALSTHQDPTYGYSFDYPASWMLDEIKLGERAPAGYQLTSWIHAPGMVSEVIEGGTIMNISIQLWEPKGDLHAFVEHRKLAWVSPTTIVSEEDATLSNGSPAKVFIVRGADGAESYVLLTTLGEDYLFASGDGDLQMLDLVARSIR